MAHYKFIRDLKDGQRGEAIAFQALINSGLYKRSNNSPPQTHGDFQLLDTKNGNLPVNIEVKYDILAESTGNMCFEFCNAKGKLTGIMATEADIVVYVLNNKDNYMLYMFLKDALKSYLVDTANAQNVRIVNGGDKKKFTMALSSIDNMSKLAFKIIEVERAKLSL